MGKVGQQGVACVYIHKTPQQPCQADVLIKLFNEKKNYEIQQKFGIQTDKYEKYETSVDLTDDE